MVSAPNLGPKRSTIESVSFDSTGWHEQEEHRTAVFGTWRNECGDRISLAVVPPGDVDLADRNAVLQFSREFVESENGALVSCEVVEPDANPSIELIYKREQGSGYVYEGIMFCPMETRMVIFNAVFSEHGTTGVREAVVTAQLLESGQLTIDFEKVSAEGESHAIPGWFFDPYDSAFGEKVLHSLSDEVKYDEMFPDHPLTKLRRTSEGVRETVQIGAEPGSRTPVE